MAPPATAATSCETRSVVVDATIHGDRRAVATRHKTFPYCAGRVTVSNFVSGAKGPSF
jgi:hypothetical protein